MHWVIRTPPDGPGIESSHPGFLGQILRKAFVASHPSGEVGVERPDGLPIDPEQLLFWQRSRHTSIDAPSPRKPTVYFQGPQVVLAAQS